MRLQDAACVCAGSVCWAVNDPLCDLSHIFSVLPAWKHVCEGERLQPGVNQIGFLLFLLIGLCRRGKPASNTSVEMILLQEALKKPADLLQMIWAYFHLPKS